jgi:AbiV family abortive infection protein
MNSPLPERHKGRPQEYRGPLSPTQIAEGMNAANRNARRLAADARILLDAGRLPTAVALATLSIEESGKVSIIRSFATVTGPDELRAAWRDYRDHRSKNGAWIFPDLVRAGGRRLSDFSPIFEREGEHTALLNSLKQVGLYTGCYGEARWSEPEKIFAEEEAKLAEHLVRTAELLAPEKQITVREIELWIEHLKPVWLTPEVPHALLRFAEAMQREGIVSTTPEEYARFIFGEPEASGWTAELPQKH